METITFEDFKKLDIRVGTIIACEKVEGADKLLRLEVDFGDFKRQIVSGIAQFYTPEDLVGKQCPFILNLEPRTIRGVESQGMLMAADPGDDSAVLLYPDKKVPEGAIIR